MDESNPAPASTTTVAPWWTSSETPSGVMATRCSASLVSLGTPTTRGTRSGSGRPAGLAPLPRAVPFPLTGGLRPALPRRLGLASRFRGAPGGAHRPRDQPAVGQAQTDDGLGVGDGAVGDQAVDVDQGNGLDGHVALLRLGGLGWLTLFQIEGQIDMGQLGAETGRVPERRQLDQTPGTPPDLLGQFPGHGRVGVLAFDVQLAGGKLQHVRGAPRPGTGARRQPRDPGAPPPGARRPRHPGGGPPTG